LDNWTMFMKNSQHKIWEKKLLLKILNDSINETNLWHIIIVRYLFWYFAKLH
jgi:hypothetical protein